MHDHGGTQICDQAHRQAQAQAQMHGQAHIILTSIFTTGLWSCLGSAILTMAPAVGPELAIPTTAPVVASGLAHTHDGVSTSTTASAVASELGHTHDYSDNYRDDYRSDADAIIDTDTTATIL
jgi:hypothetical protein